MKKEILILATFSCLFVGTINAQTFTISTDTIEADHQIGDFPSDYIYVDNNTGADLDLSYELITNTMDNIGWINTLCTHLLCMPNIPHQASFDVLADGAQGFFNLHTDFNNLPGDGELSFKIYETNNPSNADTIHFIYHIEGNVGVEETNIAPTITAYPNPFTDVLTILGVEKSSNTILNLYSLDGKIVKSMSINDTLLNLNVSDLKDGIYFVSVESNNQVLFREKFIKK